MQIINVKIKRFTTLILFLLFSLIAHSADRLNIIFFERDPWLMLMGSDEPIFVNYSSGLTIYQAGMSEDGYIYHTAQLNEKENTALLNKLSILDDLDERYMLTNYSDQASSEVHYYNQAVAEKSYVLVMKSVYGSLAKDSKFRANAPAQFIKIYDYLKNYTHKDAKVWTPDYIEITIWPYEYAPDESIVWHDDWPDIHSASTIKRDNSYSILLPYTENDKLITLLKNRKEKGAVLINDKKWAISPRILFPHEQIQRVSAQ